MGGASKSSDIPHPGFLALSPSSELSNCVCPVCSKICLNPIFPKCGHQHCARCLYNQDSCKTCQSTDLQQTIDLDLPVHSVLRKIYDSVLVTCIGCGQNVPRGFAGQLFDAHKQVCLMTCQHCNIPVEGRALRTHRDTCPERPRTCPGAESGCQFIGRLQALQEHQVNCIAAQTSPLRDAIDKITAQLLITSQLQPVENAQPEALEQVQQAEDTCSRLEERLVAHVELAHATQTETMQKLASLEKIIEKQSQLIKILEQSDSIPRAEVVPWFEHVHKRTLNLESLVDQQDKLIKTLLYTIEEHEKQLQVVVSELGRHVPASFIDERLAKLTIRSKN